MDEKFTLISYEPNIIEANTSAQLEDLLPQVQDDRISWVILRGCDASDQKDIEKLLSFFSVDPIFIEKIIQQKTLGFPEDGHDGLFFNYNIPSRIFDQSRNEYKKNRGSFILGSADSRAIFGDLNIKSNATFDVGFGQLEADQPQAERTQSSPFAYPWQADRTWRCQVEGWHFVLRP